MSCFVRSYTHHTSLLRSQRDKLGAHWEEKPCPKHQTPINAASFLTYTTATTSTTTMCKHNASRLPCLLCEHSGTTLASFAGVGPSAMPASLLGHPLWRCLAAEERSGYERDCMVADAHRYASTSRVR